jgi:hypothetical protein
MGLRKKAILFFVGFIVVLLLVFCGIAVSNMLVFLEGAQRTRTYTEMQGAELAIIAMMVDADRNSLSDFMPDSSGMTLSERMALHTQVCYELLSNGRDADYDGRPDFVELLGSSYMELGADPWGNEYLFLAWPPEKGDAEESPELISYALNIRGCIRGPVETQIAPPDKQVYILSMGKNGRLDQDREDSSDGDDLGNWGRGP